MNDYKATVLQLLAELGGTPPTDIVMSDAQFHSAVLAMLAEMGGTPPTDVVLGEAQYRASVLAMLGEVAGGGGGGMEYEEGTFSPEEAISKPTISFAKAHTAPPWLIVMADESDSADSAPTYTQYSFVLVEWARLLGGGMMASDASVKGFCLYYRRTTGSSAPTATSTSLTYGFDDEGSSNTSYARYWANESEFYPDDNNSTSMWRPGRTYKWRAFWNKEEEV